MSTDLALDGRNNEFQPSRSDWFLMLSFVGLLAYTGLLRYMPFSSSIADDRMATVSTTAKVLAAGSSLPVWLAVLCHPQFTRALRVNLPIILYVCCILGTIPFRPDIVTDATRSIPLAFALLGGALAGSIFGREKRSAIWAMQSLVFATALLIALNGIMTLIWPGAGVLIGWRRSLEGRGFLWVETAVIMPTVIALAYLYMKTSSSMWRYVALAAAVYCTTYTSSRTYLIMDALIFLILFRSTYTIAAGLLGALVIFVGFQSQVQEFLNDSRMYLPDEYSMKSLDFLTTGRLGIFEVQMEMFSESPWIGAGQAYVKDEITIRFEMGELHGRSEYGLMLHFASYGLMALFWAYYCVREGIYRPIWLLCSEYRKTALARSLAAISLVQFLAGLTWVFSQGTSGVTWYGMFLWGLQAQLFSKGRSPVAQSRVRPQMERRGPPFDDLPTLIQRPRLQRETQG